MLSINTNLSSIIAKNSIKTSTNKLNETIERMSTGYKINQAKDNAANYSISTNMTTKINAYRVAEDNVAMGLDMVGTLTESLDLVSNHVRRIRELCEQASNGAYGAESLKIIQSEIDARTAEIERLKSTTEFNGIKLLGSNSQSSAMYVTGSFIEEVDQLTEDEALAQGYTIIKTADDLQNMQNNLSGKYILMNDIDLSGYNWTPVGAFSGELNGNGFVVKNLTINKPAENDVGLFKFINGTIKNLGIENACIIANNNSGILTGEASSSGSIVNTYVSGQISGEFAVGGIVGNGGWGPTISNCYSNVNVIGGNNVGGLVGSCEYAGPQITNSYSTGTVSGNNVVGGLIGGNLSNYDATISNSYTTCSITGTSNYGSAVGCLNGSHSSFNNVYYLEQGITGGTIQSGSSGLTSKTAAELQAMIDSGQLVSAKAPVIPAGSTTSVTLQVGTNSDSNSQIIFDLATTLASLEITITDSDSARNSLSTLDNYLAQISNYQTKFGAVTNRLESALDEISIQYENLASSRSTIRDADMAKISSTYIQQQILQQASATLLSTANQSPSIALQLI